MKTHHAGLIGFLILFACLTSGPLVAGTSPSGCTDLNGFDEVPAVDFGSRIQPILDGCTGCHGASGPAGLDLRAGEAYANLVGVTATTNPDRQRVEPFSPDDSLLMSAINCQVTGGPAFQMPGTDPEDRAMIRDWIAQGALPAPAPRAVPAFSTGGAVTLMLLLLLAGTYQSRMRARFREGCAQ